jgi:hypothetical protein
MRGSYLIRSLLGGANTVIMVGPYVLKRFGGPHARRKYFSEVRARAVLRTSGVDVVPVILELRPARTIVMRRAPGPTLNRQLSRETLRAFEEHVVDLARHRLAPGEPPGFYWLDAPGQGQTHDSFVELLTGELAARGDALTRAYPQIDLRALRQVLEAAEPFPERVLVLTDIAPKNVVLANGRFAQMDLEATLVGPPEFLLVKAAVNLATDLGAHHGARDVRRRLLDRCASEPTARACLAFAVTRRLLHDAQRGRRDPRPSAALHTLLDNHPLDSAIAHLENDWDGRNRSP